MRGLCTSGLIPLFHKTFDQFSSPKRSLKGPPSLVMNLSFIFKFKPLENIGLLVDFWFFCLSVRLRAWWPLNMPGAWLRVGVRGLTSGMECGVNGGWGFRRRRGRRLAGSRNGRTMPSTVPRSELPFFFVYPNLHVNACVFRRECVCVCVLTTSNAILLKMH